MRNKKIHVHKCNITKKLWNTLDLFFNDCFHLPQLLPRTAFFGFFNTYSNLILENHILLFKIYLHNSRKLEKVTLRKFTRINMKVKDTEKERSGKGDN